MSKDKIIILIPAYKPGEAFLALLNALDEKKFFHRIVVVDDGSGKNYGPIFEQTGKFNSVFLLRHDINHGKGAAMKTGFAYIEQKYPDVLGVITVDCDGQHTPEDTANLADAIKNSPQSLVIGTRSFSGRVPLRSLAGNRFTSFLMRVLFGVWIHDTQSGLRAIPHSLISGILSLPGERYEFELEMLLHALHTKRHIHEVPISTIYERGNPTSHFRPFADSVKIYKRIFHYAFFKKKKAEK